MQNTEKQCIYERCVIVSYPYIKPRNFLNSSTRRDNVVIAPDIVSFLSLTRWFCCRQGRKHRWWCSYTGCYQVLCFLQDMKVEGLFRARRYTAIRNSLLQIYGYLLRRTAKKCPRRIPDTPAVLFCLTPCICSAYLQKCSYYITATDGGGSTQMRCFELCSKLEVNDCTRMYSRWRSTNTESLYFLFAVLIAFLPYEPVSIIA